MPEQRDEAARFQKLRAELVEKQERIEELQQRRDDLREEREHVMRQYAEALAPHSILDVDELVCRFDLDALRQKADELPGQSATMSTADPTIQSGATDQTAALGGAGDRVAELKARLTDLPNTDRGLVAHERERLESELADLRGGSQ